MNTSIDLVLYFLSNLIENFVSFSLPVLPAHPTGDNVCNHIVIVGSNEACLCRHFDHNIS